MDMITGAQVAVTLTVPLPAAQLWERITAVGRIGEWSPEATGARWCDDTGPVRGARFIGHNRFPHGLETTVICEVVESVPGRSFAWDVLDADGLAGSTWRYELEQRDGHTIVRHSFTHGPGNTGAREDPAGFPGRLGTLCRNMAATVAAMGGIALSSHPG